MMRVLFADNDLGTSIKKESLKYRGRLMSGGCLIGVHLIEVRPYSEVTTTFRYSYNIKLDNIFRQKLLPSSMQTLQKMENAN